MSGVDERQAVTRDDDPESFTHRFATTNGIRLHYVEEGEGPLVVLLHGFPYLWFTWRHQIRALAGAGYRVVAPDFRGFGQSDAPADVASYTALAVIGDLVGLINRLDEASVVIVGHDLGAHVARVAAEVRPDLFKALVLVASPIGPRAAQSPSEQWKQVQAATGTQFYHHYFQEGGDEMNADIRKALLGALFSLSDSAVGDKHFRALLRDGETILDVITEPEQLPAWLPAGALDYYVSEYERHGFTPTLNYYRAQDRGWAQTAFLDGVRLHQPSLFIGGAGDYDREDFRRGYDQLEGHLANLREKVLLDGAAHDPPEEAPDVVNRMLLEFLAAV